MLLASPSFLVSDTGLGDVGDVGEPAALAAKGRRGRCEFGWTFSPRIRAKGTACGLTVDRGSPGCSKSRPRAHVERTAGKPETAGE